MSKRKLSMRKIIEVAKLSSLGLSVRDISRSCNVPRSTVSDYINRLEKAELEYSQLPTLSEDELKARLFPQVEDQGAERTRPLPD